MADEAEEVGIETTPPTPSMNGGGESAESAISKHHSEMKKKNELKRVRKEEWRASCNLLNKVNGESRPGLAEGLINKMKNADGSRATYNGTAKNESIMLAYARQKFRIKINGGNNNEKDEDEDDNDDENDECEDDDDDDDDEDDDNDDDDRPKKYQLCQSSSDSLKAVKLAVELEQVDGNAKSFPEAENEWVYFEAWVRNNKLI